LEAELRGPCAELITTRINEVLRTASYVAATAVTVTDRLLSSASVDIYVKQQDAEDKLLNCTFVFECASLSAVHQPLDSPIESNTEWTRQIRSNCELD